ncbi:MAG: hypothetical protein NVS2B14_14510 [Chamaesiphon sp.]
MTPILQGCLLEGIAPFTISSTEIQRTYNVHSKGGNWDEWTSELADLSVREFPQHWNRQEHGISSTTEEIE